MEGFEDGNKIHLNILADIGRGLPAFGDDSRELNCGFQDSFGKEFESMPRDQRNTDIFYCEKELNVYRSGSAPPTIEGARTSVGSIFSRYASPDSSLLSGNNNDLVVDDEIRCLPAYLSYYYSHEKLNPRLPPPVLSKEDWRVAQRSQTGSSFGGIGDRRNKELAADSVTTSGKSLFFLQPDLKGDANSSGPIRVTPQNLTRQPSAEWLERETDGLIGLAGVGIGSKKKSLADMIQEGLGRSASVSGQLSRPVSDNAFDDMSVSLVASDSQLTQLHTDLEAVGSFISGPSAPSGPSLVRNQSLGSSVGHSFSCLDSSLPPRKITETNLNAWAFRSKLPHIGGRVSAAEKTTSVNVIDGVSANIVDSAKIEGALSGLCLTKTTDVDDEICLQAQLREEFVDQSSFLLNKSQAECLSIAHVGGRPYGTSLKSNESFTELNIPNGHMDGQFNLLKCSSAMNLLPRRPASCSPSLERSTIPYEINDLNLEVNGINMGLYKQRVPFVMENHLDAGPTFTGGNEKLNRNRSRSMTGSSHMPAADPYLTYLQKISDYGTHAASHMDMLGLQKIYLEAFLSQQKSQYAADFLTKFGNKHHTGHGSGYGVVLPSPGNPVLSSRLSSVGSGGFARHNDQISRFSSTVRSSTVAGLGPWHSENGCIGENIGSFLLEEFKSNKTKCFELSEIVGHVVEFSADQYGSRFIQQKLETASEDEKNQIFPEIILKARVLMTDVFGNYVIQKFFEHGTELQRKELADQLTGYVLPLSLQMYGCRVIQKALEVVDVDQQTEMVQELNGSIMKCVRDQNGNHVIQKCIECVPQERIQFIITAFYGQVVALSTHPYGCRVIQRVLEHCDDVKTQNIVMDEILQSVCTLAQDQYGNYVIQHILQHGKPHERSAIISKLAGQIVKMSQQKFASNVVEKCLTYGEPEQRQLLVNEMLGTTDENEPLQAMMKDQYANYVVQKVLETCNDQSRELILSRIRIHLNALKRYTYGKHIVARVEKLITAGERRNGIASSCY